MDIKCLLEIGAVVPNDRQQRRKWEWAACGGFGQIIQCRFTRPHLQGCWRCCRQVGRMERGQEMAINESAYPRKSKAACREPPPNKSIGASICFDVMRQLKMRSAAHPNIHEA